jgi:hypothetical protein
MRDPRIITTILNPWFRACWLFLNFQIKEGDNMDEIPGCFIDPTDCNERTNCDGGKKVFSGI